MQKLRKTLENIGINPIEPTLDKFKIYQGFLHSFNSHTNLTSIKDLEEIETRHFVDSLSLLQFCKRESEDKANINLKKPSLLTIRSSLSFLDIGCGAGFPSIPLALALDALNIPCLFTLVDSVKKKTDFLKELIEKLSLTNITIFHSRIEDLTHLKNSFDIIVNRAVASLPTLLEYSLPFLKTNGHLIAYKGKNAEEELALSKNALSTLGGKFVSLTPYQIDEIEFKLLVIEKEKSTSTKYPRGQNKPRLKPL
ncbi:MAG: 16S rRNA (guanine(527)-N(7))-methyltransferase RsmG [Firmicutes bacterium]|nr:16S rRNA (guanine(527)-N(7))-methyltransferase RsmG [Bacillota bacterium]MCL2256010.1 16S rRNA (guanine(527)-N(7))-methyltransferase RsmG [Bacillota bacterium]